MIAVIAVYMIVMLLVLFRRELYRIAKLISLRGQRMLCDESQRESRVRENRMHGLVYGVKRSGRSLRSFTLIERVPREGWRS